MADTYPEPIELSTTVAEALSGTTDEGSQLAYLATGTKPGDGLVAQFNRIAYNLRKALAGAMGGFVVKTDTLKVGAFPLSYRKSDGTAVRFEGADDFVLTSSATNYLYILHSTNALTVSTGGWPADLTTFTPLAEAVCGVSDITGDIIDRRDLSRHHTNSSSASPTGTTAIAFTTDSDNAGAGVDQQYRCNRGTDDAEDAAIEWDETDDRFNLKSQHTTGTLCPVNASEVQVSGSTMLDADGAAKVQAAVAGDGLVEAAGVLSVNIDDSTIEIDTDALQLKDGGISTTKLGDTLADKLVQISVGDASGASPRTVTIQAKDIQGNNLAEVIYMRIGVYDDADGTTPATNATIADGGAGSIVRSLTVDKDIIFKTDATGALEVQVTDAVAETVYILASAAPRSRMMDCADIGTVVIS